MLLGYLMGVAPTSVVKMGDQNHILFNVILSEAKDPYDEALITGGSQGFFTPGGAQNDMEVVFNRLAIRSVCDNPCRVECSKRVTLVPQTGAK
ncbi:MAG: hypothetical protein AMJ88_05845 [Anaerolineae bacterium SM23_ 63]|nr:MAG: hypothetical protein AMJ88_05845 [Anaerolineae bacterium SM23_ 63]